MKEFIEAIKKGDIEEIETYLNGNRIGELHTILSSLPKHKIAHGRLVKKHQYALERKGLGGLMTYITLPEDNIVLIYITHWLTEITYNNYTRYSIRLLYSDNIPENADNNIIFQIRR